MKGTERDAQGDGAPPPASGEADANASFSSHTRCCTEGCGDAEPALLAETAAAAAG